MLSQEIVLSEQMSQEVQKQTSTTINLVPEATLNVLDIGTQMLTTSEIAPDAVVPAITEVASALAEGVQEVAAEGASVLVEAAAELFSGLF